MKSSSEQNMCFAYDWFISTLLYLCRNVPRYRSTTGLAWSDRTWQGLPMQFGEVYFFVNVEMAFPNQVD